VAAVTLLLWPALRERLLSRLKIEGGDETKLLPLLYWVHCGLLVLGVAGLSVAARSQRECTVNLLGLSVGELHLGLGWRLNSLRLLWLQGTALLVWCTIPFVARDMAGAASRSAAARTGGALLVLIGLLFQVILGEGVIHPVAAWLLVPLALWWLCGSSSVCPQGAEPGPRPHGSLFAAALTGLPLFLSMLLVCNRAGSAEGQTVYYSLASGASPAALWLGLLVVVSILVRTALLTVGSWPRACAAESSAWCACVEVLLPWADLFVLVRYVPALLPVDTLRALAGAQVAVGVAVCAAVVLGVAATPREHRPGLPPVNVLALWGVALVLAGGKSSIAWACAIGYVFNYCLLVMLAHGVQEEVPAKGRALVQAVSLAAAVALPHCLSGQMAWWGARELLTHSGRWAACLLLAALATLAWTHLAPRRRFGYASPALPAVLWVAALTMGLAQDPVRQLLSGAFADMGLTLQW
jgi:hypothetical protein